MKQLLIYLYKTIQFRLITWKNKVEIKKAYTGNRRRFAYIRPICMLAAALLAGIGLVTLVSIFVIAPLASALTSTTEKSPTADSAKNGSASRSSQRGIIHDKAVSRVLSEKVTDSIKGIYSDRGRRGNARAGNLTYAPRRAIYVNKRLGKLFLLRYTGSGWETQITWPAATGRSRGDKVREGDQKTPEGTYFIIGRREDRELSAIYGPAAFILNYPNREDIIRAKTGNGIWIHGTAPDSSPVNTRGCIELDNNDLRQLADTLGLGIGTPVIIREGETSGSSLSIPSYDILSIKRGYRISIYKTTQRYFENKLAMWTDAWEAQNIDLYSQFYDTSDFRGGGLDWKRWRDKKIRTFQIYSHITVDLSHIRVTEFSNDRVVLKFIQDYSSESFNAYGGKKMVFRKKNDTWKIFRENVFPREELVL